MKSKIHVSGHPVHPMLIPLPVTCAIGALVSDIVAKVTGSPGWYFMGYILTIGVWATGLLAAIPGLADYLYRVPKQTQVMKDASIHMILNVCIVGLYFASWLIKNRAGGPDPAWSAFILEIIGNLLLVVSGWYGWTLVYKHRMGIDEPPLSESQALYKKAG